MWFDELLRILAKRYIQLAPEKAVRMNAGEDAGNTSQQ